MEIKTYWLHNDMINFPENTDTDKTQSLHESFKKVVLYSDYKKAMDQAEYLFKALMAAKPYIDLQYTSPTLIHIDNTIEGFKSFKEGR